jgi:hypothetical protein
MGYLWQDEPVMPLTSDEVVASGVYDNIRVQSRL